MSTLNLRPSRLDIDGTVGDDISVLATVVDELGAPVDVSSYTITAQVLRNAVPIASFGQVVGGAGNNEITLTLTDTQTASIDNVPGLIWRMRIVNGASTQTWIAGDFELGDVVPKDSTGVSSTVVTVASITITVIESGGGGAGDLLSTNNLSDVASVATSQQNLNLEPGVDVQAWSVALDAVAANVTVTQAVDLDAVEARVNALDAAVVLVGVWDASSGSFPGGGTAQAGESWIVSVAGTVDSVAFAVGDRIIAITDNASTATFAANWFHADYTDVTLGTVAELSAIPHQIAVTFPSDVVETGTVWGWDATFDGTFVRSDLSCLTAPTTAAIIGDVNKNGTTVYTTQANRPQIATSATRGESGAPQVTTFSKGDRFEWVVDQLNVADTPGRIIGTLIVTETIT